MCGIIGIVSNNECIDFLLNGLLHLQNRGYDSAGICAVIDQSFVIKKYASTTNILSLNKLQEDRTCFLNSNVGIGHTRWATHGKKSDINSHPHISSDAKFVIVHNGIIENYHVLKEMLQINGYSFISETDSEVICNLLSYNYMVVNNNISIEKAIELTTNQLEGTWGLCILCIDTPNTLYCTRNGSPLLVGLDDDFVMVASEQSGFDGKILRHIELNNKDICIISKQNDKPIDIVTQHSYNAMITTAIDIPRNTYSLKEYPYWTLKEIYEQTNTFLSATNFGGRLLENTIKLGGLESKIEQLKQIDNLILLGCGSSYNAGMVGLKYFKDLCQFNCVQLIDGADFTLQDIPKKGKTGLILLSQSGETRDLHRCILIAQTNCLCTIGVINVVGSLIAREVDCGCYLNAGKETAVAATKSFTSQCILLSMIAIWFSQMNKHNIKTYKYVTNLKYLCNNNICELLNADFCLEKKIDEILPLFNTPSCFVLGKGICEAIAHEGSLKIKEISYIHSESFSTSSLKHGPFALLHAKFPVILIALDDEYLPKNINAYQELLAREATVIVITNKNVKYFDGKDNIIYIPYNETYNAILSVVPLQLLAYKLAIFRGINPDFPKNLAKVVTVE